MCDPSLGPVLEADEDAPLLGDSQTTSRTPLPVLQIGIVLLLHLCEPVCSQSIYPYINELVSDLDIVNGDPKKVGYYAGLIESLFFATEALTVFQWSRASDSIGRKPVLLVGLVGMAISMLCFGLSRTMVTLVISRCLTGLLNGNLGVLKSAMGELTDNSNRADAFALLPVAWGVGASIGPLFGGLLARPSDRYPTIFKGSFWKEFPYFLPCLAGASLVSLCIIVTAFWFKESNPVQAHLEKKPFLSLVTHPSSHSDAVQSPPIRQLLVFPVAISVSNYMGLAFLNISATALLPLFLHMPIATGGLALKPHHIGYIMGAYGGGTGLFQMLFFARIVRRFGVRRTYVCTIAKHQGLSPLVWSLLGVILVLLFVMDTAYGCIFMYVTTSAPNRSSLGAVNGLAQTSVSIARAIGPALATSLYSFSVEKDILSGYGIFFVLAVLSWGALLLSFRLPSKLWSQDDEAA